MFRVLALFKTMISLLFMENLHQCRKYFLMHLKMANLSQQLLLITLHLMKENASLTNSVHKELKQYILYFPMYLTSSKKLQKFSWELLPYNKMVLWFLELVLHQQQELLKIIILPFMYFVRAINYLKKIKQIPQLKMNQLPKSRKMDLLLRLIFAMI